jgi:hypothetical protein
MAGAGYKLFNTGDVLTAAQVNTYLNEQSVMVFASSTARTTALSGVLAEGMMSYLQDTNAVEVYNGSSWVNVGNAGDITEVQAGTGISIASGTGPIPVVTNTVATAFDAAGDLVYGTGADTFTKLSLGTAGQVLKVNSGATAPEWGAAASGGMTLLSTTTLSGTAVNLTSISQSYKNLHIIIVLDDYSNDNQQTYMRFNNDSTANRYAALNSIATTSTFSRTNITVTPGADNGTSYGLSQIVIPNYTGASWKMAIIDPISTDSATPTSVKYERILGVYNQTTAISEINFVISGGTYDGGTVLLYGVN